MPRFSATTSPWWSLRLVALLLIVSSLTLSGISIAAGSEVRPGPRTTLALTESPDSPRPTWTLAETGTRSRDLVLSLGRLDLQEVVADGRTWQRLEIPGAFETGATGEPGLPTLGQMVRVPSGMTLEAEVTSYRTVSLPGLQIFPVQENEAAEFTHLAPAYERHVDLKEQRPEVRIGSPALMAGSRVVPVTVTAAAYDPAGQEAVVWPEIHLKLRFVPDTPLAGEDSASPLPGAFASAVLDATGEDTLTRTYGTYVAIHSGMGGVLSAIEPLLDWRRRQGYHVVAINTLLVGNTPQSIKAALQQIYDDPDIPPLEFVTIFGDADGTYAVPAWNEDLSGYGGDGDHYYVTLAGDDILADAHIGRVSFSNPTEMAIVIDKILGYETNPPMDDTAWFGRACLQGDPSASGITTIYVNQWLKGQLQEEGFSHVDTTWSGNFPIEMMASVNQGSAVYGYRGYLGTSGISNGMVNSLTNGGRLAMAILPTCGSGSFAYETARSEAWLRAPNGGAVAAIGTATTGTHTRYNNCYYVGAWDGLINRGDSRAGVGHTLGKLALYNGYYLAEPHIPEIWAVWNNVMGDGATAIWLGVPAEMTVDYTGSVATGGQALPVTVSSDGQPLAGAVITLYRRDILTGNHLQISAVTGPDGTAVLDVPEVNSGELALTVTAPGHLPHLGSLVAGQPGVHCGVTDMAADGPWTPAAALELLPTLGNQGTAGATGVSAVISLLDGPADMAAQDIYLGDIPAGGQVTADETIALQVLGSARDGETIRLLVTATDGQETWQSLEAFTVTAADLTVDALILDSFAGEVDPGESGLLDVVLFNGGSLDAAAVEATLRTDSPWITILDDEAVFGDIPGGETGRDLSSPFRIAASPDCFGGHLAVFHLDITYADGARAEAACALTVGAAATDQPTGPDAHGYYAFDDTDIASGMAPAFAWVGIDPDHGGQGSDLGLADFGYEQDDTRTIDLPFTFRFYGEDYDQVSICSNGWLAMGETPLNFYRNFPLPAPHSAGALIAPFWDNLYQVGQNRVYTWHDTENHRFIVQWYGLRNSFSNAPQNFEVILLDPAHHATVSGDGMIVFQYELVSDTDTRDGHATIGIQNMARDIGLNYGYWNQYAAGASPAAGGRAILFAPYGPPAVPAAAVTPPFIDETLAPGQQTTRYLHIANQGEEGSVLDFSLEVIDPLLLTRDRPDGDGAAREDERNLTGSNVTSTVTSYLAGASFDLPLAVACVSDDVERIVKVKLDFPIGVTVTAADDLTGPSEPMAWNGETGDGVITTWGTGPFGSGGIILPGQTAQGQVSLGMDPAMSGDVVIGWTLEGDLEGAPPHTVSGEMVLTPLVPTITVSEPVQGQIATLGEELAVVFSAENGPALVSIDLQRSPDGPWQNLALAWPADQSPWLWTVAGEAGPHARFRVRDATDPTVAGLSGVFGIGRNLDWLQPAVAAGTVPQGESVDVALTLDAAELSLGSFEAVVRVQHNGGLEVDVPVDLEVTDASSAGQAPPATRLWGNHPDPFNPATTIRFSLAEAGEVALTVYDVRGQKIARLLSGTLPAGGHDVLWDGRDGAGKAVASGVYFTRLETPAGVFTEKMVLAR